MSHIPIDFGRPFDVEFFPPSSYLFPGLITLACFTLLERGVHTNGIFVVEKGIPCSSFTKKIFPARKHV